MIQDHNNINGNNYYNQSLIDNSSILPNMPINRVQDQTEFLLNGQHISMDIQQTEAQQSDLLQPQLDLSQLSQQDQQVQQQFSTYFANTTQQYTLQQQQQYFYSRMPLFNNSDCPPTPDDTPPIVSSINDTSNTSTIDEEINQTEEKYAYLQELNSDNLMQFSQQSMLQEMLLKEQFQGKSNLDTLPTVEEHDIGGYNFKLTTSNPHKKGKSSWSYSEGLNKLYIRMNDTFTVDAVYTPKFPIQPLRLRSFICFSKEVNEPVLRCQNHLSKDNETNNVKRESVLRCDNPNAEYSGFAHGNSIKERFSVSIPLTAGVTQSDKSIKQTIAFKFTCQNSCIGRKETCLMFLLEGINGEILSQRILNLRICTCPKRDRQHDEKSSKRKGDGDVDLFQPESKIPKREASTPTPSIKDENSCSDYENAAKQFDLQRTASGGFRLVMEISTKEIALSTIDYVFAKESANIVTESKEAARSTQNIRKLKRLYDNCADFR